LEERRNEKESETITSERVRVAGSRTTQASSRCNNKSRGCAVGNTQRVGGRVMGMRQTYLMVTIEDVGRTAASALRPSSPNLFSGRLNRAKSVRQVKGTRGACC
jgi:hypothetical protein